MGQLLQLCCIPGLFANQQATTPARHLQIAVDYNSVDSGQQQHTTDGQQTNRSKFVSTPNSRRVQFIGEAEMSPRTSSVQKQKSSSQDEEEVTYIKRKRHKHRKRKLNTTQTDGDNEQMPLTGADQLDQSIAHLLWTDRKTVMDL